MRVPPTTVYGLLDAVAFGTTHTYCSERWVQNGGRVERVGTVLGRLVDRGLVDWPKSGVADCKLTPYGRAYFEWLRNGRRGKKPKNANLAL